MSETVNQGTGNEKPKEAGNQQERTYTQDELNAILKDRLAQQQEKFGDYDELKAKAEKFDEAEEASKSELQKAKEKADELQQEVDSLKSEKALTEIRGKVSKDTGVPADLLSGETEEACQAQAEAIIKFAKPAGYPQVPDGGENTKPSGGKTSDQFADWFNKAIK